MALELRGATFLKGVTSKRKKFFPKPLSGFPGIHHQSGEFNFFTKKFQS